MRTAGHGLLGRGAAGEPGRPCARGL
ncbi:MAG: hypothetical protein AAF282_09530 [Cyanobacteria bacterium P01_A01_bin.15]